MSRFMEERSEAFERTVEALKQLLEAEGQDGVSRAYAEVMEPVVLKAFCKNRRVKPGPGPGNCVAPLFGKKHKDPDTPWGPWCEYCGVPGDHSQVLVGDGGRAVFVTQPYRLRWEWMQKLVEWCKQRGLRADVSAWDSWYFAGRTVAILIAKEEPLRVASPPAGDEGEPQIDTRPARFRPRAG